jgi:hypothetical protein
MIRWILANLALAVVIALLFYIAFARAHDAMHLSDWVAQGGFRDPSSGESCCGENDCKRLPDDGIAETMNGMFIRETSEVFPFPRIIWKSLDGGWWRCAPRDLLGVRSNKTRCLIGPPRAM